MIAKLLVILGAKDQSLIKLEFYCLERKQKVWALPLESVALASTSANGVSFLGTSQHTDVKVSAWKNAIR